MGRWFIDSLSIAGGFLGDFSLRFPPGLICVIGPRGSGKSTLAEALRVALGGVPGAQAAPKSRLETIKANLGGAVLTITTAPGTERGAVTVQRVVGQAASLSGTDGRPITSVELDRGTFLPLDAYSSLEIETIADESLGGKRRALLDDLRPSELQRINLKLAEQRRILEANADGIETARRTINDLSEQMEELGDARGHLQATAPVSAQTASPAFAAAARQKQTNEREAELLDQTLAGLAQLRQNLSRVAPAARATLPPTVGVAESANAPITTQVDAAMRALWPVVEPLLDDAGRQVSAVEEAVRRVQADLKAAHVAQEAVYLTHQQANQQAVQALQARTAAEQAVQKLDDLQRRREQARQDLAALEEQRRDLRTEYLLLRDQVSELRQAVAADLQAEAGSKVRVYVRRNADDLEYQERLSAALKGSSLKNQGDILRVLSGIRPEELAQIIRENDAGEFDARVSLGKERNKKVLDALRSGVDPIELEMLVIEDKVCIELNVATGGEPNYKDASELSRGQKCTALLPILLARRDTPLVIDQPEDNLDNHFIYETVVDTIRRVKTKRQLLFITHNANIPVLGEADLVVVMNSDGRRGFVQKAGTVDECRDEIVDLLEGGVEAFEQRRKRYGTS